MENKNLKLNKEQINSIKYYVKEEQETHKYGTWDKFTITYLRIHSNGDYYFRLRWNYHLPDISGSTEVYEGNLFNEFPIFSVYDGLDCIKMLFLGIHIKAYDRLKEYCDYANHILYDEIKYYIQLYEKGSYYNKESKDVLNIFE